MLEKLKEFNKKSLLPKGYKADNRIFRSALVIIGIWLILAGFQTPDKHYYLACEGDLPCFNAIYKSDACEILHEEDLYLCDLEVLPPGFVVGERSGFLYNYALLFAFFIMLCAIVLNHLLFNKGYKFEGDRDE